MGCAVLGKRMVLRDVRYCESVYSYDAWYWESVWRGGPVYGTRTSTRHSLCTAHRQRGINCIPRTKRTEIGVFLFDFALALTRNQRLRSHDSGADCTRGFIFFFLFLAYSGWNHLNVRCVCVVFRPKASGHQAISIRSLGGSL